MGVWLHMEIIIIIIIITTTTTTKPYSATSAKHSALCTVLKTAVNLFKSKN